MHVVLLRIGIDSGCGGFHGILFGNHSFEYIPIPDSFNIDRRTYGNKKGRHGRYLIEYFPERRHEKMKDQSIHYDPEFKTFTYGDPVKKGPKRRLRKLKKSDLLVLYCSLQEWDQRKGLVGSRHQLYIIGYFEVAKAGLATDFNATELQKDFGNNFHVRHPAVLKKQKKELMLVKGGKRSRLLEKAVKISSDGKDKAGRRLKVLSPEMRKKFCDFGGRNSIQRSTPRWVRSEFGDRSAKFIRGLK